MSNLWRSIESLAGGSHVAAEWARISGGDFVPLRSTFLRDAQKRAKHIVCPEGCGCLHEVVERGKKLAAVCRCEPWNCEDLALTPAAAALLTLNHSKLGRDICRAFDGAPRETDLGVQGTKQIGSFGNGALAVVLMIRPDSESFSNAVAQLVARLPEHFILLSPTRRFRSGNSLTLLKTAKAGFFDLESNLILLPSGKLQARKSGGELFSPYLPKASEPTDENQARQVFALIEKLESGRRLKTPSVMDVFQLYCIKGKTAEQIVDACKTSKGTVVNRLKVIRQVTGKEPEDLRAFSPYLQQIEEAITDSRAEHIHRKALVHDVGEQEDERE
jgi:hypothetical protein